jgi:hypothetical protein
LDFNNSSFIMSDFENYETTFNHFLLHFLRYLCNFCPDTCSQEAKLTKGSHLGVVTLNRGSDIPYPSRVQMCPSNPSSRDGPGMIELQNRI